MLPSIRLIFTVQFLLVGVSSVALFFVSPAQLPAFLGGAGLATLNFYLLAELWRGVLTKKPVARTIIVVVIKYAILGVLLYLFVSELKFSLLPLFAGVSTLMGTFVIAALRTHFLERNL